MKRILFTLVSSFLFFSAANAALYPDAGNPTGPFVVGTAYTFTFYYGTASPFGQTSGTITSANTTLGTTTGLGVTVGAPSFSGFTVTVTVTPNNNGLQVVNLNVSGTISGAANTSSTAISINGVLAVELVDFSAKSIASNKTNVNWTTASEKDNSMFKVETSTNGESFKAVGEVKGMGTSTVAHDYTFTDNTAYDAAVVYYRLTSVDFAGTESYSKVVSVVTGNKGKLSLDNISSTSGNVIFASPSSDKATLSVYTTAGQVVYSSDIAAAKGANNVSVNLSNLSTGLYIARLSNANEASTLKFFVGK